MASPGRVKMFCPHCRSILRPEKGALKCFKCNYVKEPEVLARPKEHPLVESVTCRKCGEKGKCLRQGRRHGDDEVPTVELVLIKTFKCTRCGFEFDDDEDPRGLAVFKDLDTMPIDDNVFCSKCGTKGAYWHLRQTRAADEATTRFYRCISCKHTWREYA